MRDLLAVSRDCEISGFVSAAFGTKGGKRTFAASAKSKGRSKKAAAQSINQLFLSCKRSESRQRARSGQSNAIHFVAIDLRIKFVAVMICRTSNHFEESEHSSFAQLRTKMSISFEVLVQ